MSFTVLFVCTGNICRSPMAERLLAARLPDHPIRTASAGTRAVVGYGMDRTAAHVLRELGGDPDGHVARQITPEMVRSAGLVLTATTTHRDAVIRANPGAMRRTFTLREFVRLGSGADEPGTDPTRRVLAVAGRRGVAEPAHDGADDIADPYGAPLAVMERCGEEISDAIDAVVGILGGRPSFSGE